MNEVSHPMRLVVDGGVKESNVQDIAKAGADTFVMGSAIFQSKNYQQAIEQMKKALG